MMKSLSLDPSLCNKAPAPTYSTDLPVFPVLFFHSQANLCGLGPSLACSHLHADFCF